MVKTVNFPCWELNVFYQMATVVFPAWNSSSQSTDARVLHGTGALSVKCAAAKAGAYPLESHSWHLFQCLDMYISHFQSLTDISPSFQDLFMSLCPLTLLLTAK